MSTANTFGSMKPNMKETYSDDKKKKFKRMKKMFEGGKATAEKDASKNPMGYLESHQNMSIKGKKGVAF